MTIMRHNKDQMKPVVRLAESLGAGSVSFNVVQPTARGEKLHSCGQTLGIEELIDLGAWVENTLSASTPLPLYYSQPLAFIRLGRVLGQDGNGCGVCGILGILGVLGNGSYALCGIGETVPDLVFGHAARDGLEGVWKKTPILVKLREGLPSRLEGICGNCLMKGICLGSCIAENYYLSNSLWTPFWYCQKAYERGLFPETRMLPRGPAGGRCENKTPGFRKAGR
jgi:SynChlorMet cassette radical SAM/SPASM protein ScmF